MTDEPPKMRARHGVPTTITGNPANPNNHDHSDGATIARLRKTVDDQKYRIDALRGQLAKTEAGIEHTETLLTARVIERDGWRKLAEAMFTAAFGTELRGFGSVPPTELLEAIDGRGDSEIVQALRDAMIGRAWHVSRFGHCDYPLCPNRTRNPRPGVATRAIRFASPTAPRREISYCEYDGKTDGTAFNECGSWATWVAARAQAGRIDIK